MKPTYQQLIKYKEESVHKIGKKFGTSGKRILDYYRLYNIEKPRATIYNGEKGKFLKDLYLYYYRKGFTGVEIREKLNIGYDVVQNLCKLYNLPEPRKQWQILASKGLKRCYKCHKPFPIKKYQNDAYNDTEYLFCKQKRCPSCQNKLMLKRQKTFQIRFNLIRKKLNYKYAAPINLKWLKKNKKRGMIKLALESGHHPIRLRKYLKRL